MTAPSDIVRAFSRIIDSAETNHPGVMDTPGRAAAAWFEKTRGYKQDPGEVFKTFESAKGSQGMIIVRDIEVESMCEHHLERIWGYAHIGYIPNERILGLSKFSRLVDIFARRLQIQERLTSQIADMLVQRLAPQGVGVVIEARHGCIESRGVNKRGQVALTSELRGCFYEDAATRAEFISLAKTTRIF